MYQSVIIYQSFDNGFKVRGVSLDISKAFYKVWHSDLIYKLKQNGVAGNLLNTLVNFLNDRKQCWTRASSRFNSRTTAFFLYINVLSKNLFLNPKIFADGTSPFSVIFDKDLSAKNLNDDLNRINNWTFQWKMSFNPDHNNQAQEVLFSRKIQKSSRPSMIFKNKIATQAFTHKHLRMFFDNKLDFKEHRKSIFSKVNKTIGLLQKLCHILLRPSLLTIYKSFIRPHLDYGGIIYDQAYNTS